MIATKKSWEWISLSGMVYWGIKIRGRGGEARSEVCDSRAMSCQGPLPGLLEVGMGASLRMTSYCIPESPLLHPSWGKGSGREKA